MPTSAVTADHLDRAFDYASYRQQIRDLLAEGKSTGTKQSEALTKYSKLNESRMKRLDKTYKPSEGIDKAVDSLSESWIWLVLTEGWCGDAAQNVPLMQKIAERSAGKIELRLLLRDENLDLMDAYLTNGGRSIPKLICLRATDHQELGTWGPRPAPVQEMVMAHKEKPEEDFATFAEKVHAWYARDKARTFELELIRCMQEWRDAE